MTEAAVKSNHETETLWKQNSKQCEFSLCAASSWAAATHTQTHTPVGIGSRVSRDPYPRSDLPKPSLKHRDAPTDPISCDGAKCCLALCRICIFNRKYGGKGRLETEPEWTGCISAIKRIWWHQDVKPLSNVFLHMWGFPWQRRPSLKKTRIMSDVGGDPEVPSWEQQTEKEITAAITSYIPGCICALHLQHALRQARKVNFTKPADILSKLSAAGDEMLQRRCYQPCELWKHFRKHEWLAPL